MPRPPFKNVDEREGTLYLLQLRSHFANVNAPKIRVSVQSHQDHLKMGPKSVRIVHR